MPYLTNISIDNKNHYYFSGTFSSQFVYDSVVVLINIKDQNNLFVIKTDANGKFISGVRGGTFSDYADSAKFSVDASGSIYLSGNINMYSDADFGKFGERQFFSWGRRNVVIVKFDTNGSCKWIKPLTGWKAKSLNDITNDEFGNIFVAGRFKDSISFINDVEYLKANPSENIRFQILGHVQTGFHTGCI